MKSKMGWSIKLIAVGFLVAATHSFSHAGGLAEDCSVDSTSSACIAPGTDVGNYTSEGSDLAGPQTVPQNNPTTTDPVFSVNSVPAYPSVSALNASAAPAAPALPIDLNSSVTISYGAVSNLSSAGFAITSAAAYLNNGAGPTVGLNDLGTLVQNGLASPYIPAAEQLFNAALQSAMTEGEALISMVNKMFMLSK